MFFSLRFSRCLSRRFCHSSFIVFLFVYLRYCYCFAFLCCCFFPLRFSFFHSISLSLLRFSSFLVLLLLLFLSSSCSYSITSVSHIFVSTLANPSPFSFNDLFFYLLDPLCIEPESIKGSVYKAWSRSHWSPPGFVYR